MKTPSQASHPTSQSDRTLRMAVLCLGGFALLQALAVLVALAPALRMADLTAPRDLPPVTATTAPAAQLQQAIVDETPVFVAASEEVIAQANAMLEQADTLRAQGNLDGAFAALGEADYLVPGEPGILYQMAIVAFELGRLTDSRELAARAISMPAVRADPNYAEVYQQLTILLSELGAPAQGLSSTGEPLPGAATPPAPPRTEGTAPLGAPTGSPGAGMLRDDAGIPIGSVFGIVEARLTDGEPGFKNLRVATKASPTEVVNASDFKVAVYFYEQLDDGTIAETDANVMSEWLSPPIDWAEGEPELLELRYPMPSEDRGDMGDVQYHGYVVGIYFKGELQDSRAEPVAVLEKFPLPLTSAASESQE